MSARFKLFCVLKKSESSFHVDLAEDATVSELKEAILIKNKNTLLGVDAHQLKVWKVCAFEHLNLVLTTDKHYISAKDLRTQLVNLQLRDGNALDDTRVLLPSEFSDASLGQIHVIAEAPDGEYPYTLRMSGSGIH